MIRKGLAVAVILLFIGVAFAPTFSSAVTPSTTTTYDGSLSGYVKNTDMEPIDGARVRVYFHGTYEEEYTDSSGYYHVTNIPICYCLKNATASKVGYETEWILLSITENTTHDFVLTSLDPIHDLDCDGTLSWAEVTPGETVTGTFTVENIGDPGSELDWEIESHPDWGTSWTFTPDSGTGLFPGIAVTINVEVVAPEDPETEVTGSVKIVNLENSSDYCIIDVFLRIKSIDDATPIELVFQLITKLHNHKEIHELEENKDFVDNIQEEILSIIEGDEELNSIFEKLSNEDCGCEGDSSKVE